MLAHELRNPLAPITNAVALIKRKAPVNATLRWCLEVIDGQLGQMSRILEDLVDVSRITRGKLELRLAATDLVPVVQSAIETSRPLIESNRHELTVDLPEAPIWRPATRRVIPKWWPIFSNNAAKYTEPGGRIGLSVKASSAGAEYSRHRQRPWHIGGDVAAHFRYVYSRRSGKRRAAWASA